MAFCSSLNDISLVAIEHSSVEYLAIGILVADVLVLTDDCTPYKCCIICSLTSYEKINKLHPFAEPENKTLLLFVNVEQEKYDLQSK
jgi:hypothetical protein